MENSPDSNLDQKQVYTASSVKDSIPEMVPSSKSEIKSTHSLENKTVSSVVIFFIFILIYFVILIGIKTFFGMPTGILMVLILPLIASYFLTNFIKILLKKVNNKFEKNENNIKPKNKKILSILLWTILLVLLLVVLPVFKGNLIAILDYLLHIPLKILYFFINIFS